MYWIRTDGNVDVSDTDGRDGDLMDNLGLYSGCQVETRAESYAGINLNAV